MTELKKTLEQRGYTVYLAKDGKEACDIAVGIAPAGSQVGIGGCATAQEIGLQTALREQGHEVLWHWEIEPKERRAFLRRVLDCTCYYLSANALLTDGRIINIDGNGNRVATSMFGPQKVVFIVGKNKIVDGGYEDGMARIRREASPKNGKRLGLKTPCAITGVCTDCQSPDRMCKGISVLERPTSWMEGYVILVDEALGF